MQHTLPLGPGVVMGAAASPAALGSFSMASPFSAALWPSSTRAILRSAGAVRSHAAASTASDLVVVCPGNTSQPMLFPDWPYWCALNSRAQRQATAGGQTPKIGQAHGERALHDKAQSVYAAVGHASCRHSTLRGGGCEKADLSRCSRHIGLPVLLGLPCEDPLAEVGHEGEEAEDADAAADDG